MCVCVCVSLCVCLCVSLCVCLCVCVGGEGVCVYQAPLSIGFSRQEYWSGVPLPSPMGLHKVGHD